MGAGGRPLEATGGLPLLEVNGLPLEGAEPGRLPPSKAREWPLLEVEGWTLALGKVGEELFNKEISVVCTGSQGVTSEKKKRMGVTCVQDRWHLLELLHDDGFPTTTHTLGQTNHNPLHTVFETTLSLRQNTTRILIVTQGRVRGETGGSRVGGATGNCRVWSVVW